MLNRKPDIVEFINKPGCLLKNKPLGGGGQLLNIYINTHS